MQVLDSETLHPICFSVVFFVFTVPLCSHVFSCIVSLPCFFSVAYFLLKILPFLWIGINFFLLYLMSSLQYHNANVEPPNAHKLLYFP